MEKKEVGLKRELGLFQVTIASIGIILGAGIYAVIGVAAGSSGNATWLAFLISAVIALFTGLSYAELSTMFKRDAGEFDYVKAALGKRFAYFIGFSVIAAGFISAATVALGFAGYFTQLVAIPFLLAAILIIVLMTLINFVGIKETNWINTISTFIELIGLLLIVILGLKYFGRVDYLEMPEGITGVFSSAALVFFAYLGFESIIKLSEETKNPEKVIPKALLYSIVITSVIYTLVAVSAVSIIGWDELSKSSAPLASVAAASLGGYAFLLLGIIALFSTSNTVLIIMVATSRMIYGMAKEKFLPGIFSLVHKRTRTPYVAIFIIMILTIIFALIGDIGFVANLTNLFVFATFATVNLSLIVLRYKCKEKKGFFRCPVNVGKFPVISLLGLLSSLSMLGFVIYNLL